MIESMYAKQMKAINTYVHLIYDRYGFMTAVVFSVHMAEYDPWGKQEVTLNRIGLRRGYTGHEMLPEFGLVNMNGRLYDPALGQFLSPDPYVQFPGLGQSWNPYSYCLNNPMKYTDPSGEFLWAPFVGFALFNTANSMANAAMNGQNIWKAAALSLLSSAASYGVGQIFGNVGNFGKELLRAGAHGVSGGVVGMLDGKNFGSSFISSALSSGMGSYAQGVKMNPGLMILSSSAIGGLTAWVTGEDFVSGALQGMKIGFFNHAYHVIGQSTTSVNEEGEFETNLPELEIIEKSLKQDNIGNSLSAAGLITTLWNFRGKSYINEANNSTVGSNGKYYFKKYGELPFNGNQYVQTTRLTDIGIKLARRTAVVGYSIEFAQVGNALSHDLEELNQTGHTNYYHSVKEISTFAGSLGGASFGMEMGASIGAGIGGLFGGVGAIPGAIIGGTVGGLLGSLAIGKLSGMMIENIYGFR